MVTKKKTDKQKQPKKKAKAAPKKVVKAASTPKGEQKPRHPRGRVTSLHGSKDALAKSLADSLAKADEDTGVIADRLRTASNSQLLRLQHVVETVKSKYGDRTKLIAKIGSTENKGKDKDFLAKLDSFSLPQLLDLAQSHEKRARA